MENITRNTKLYKLTTTIHKKKVDILYRDLNALEYAFLNNIKNNIVKTEMAGRTVLFNKDPDSLPYGILLQIGEDILQRTADFLDDTQIFEITIKDFRESLIKDDAMIAIKHILTYMPGQSFTDLIKLNMKDLLELVCLCEFIAGKPILDVGKKHGLINKSKLPDDGKSLQEKMNALNTFVGIPK